MTGQTNFFKNFARAARLPFLSASILPFVLGSLIPKPFFNFPIFIFGLSCVISCHLSANLINDYADSRSSVDWLDKNFYGFFGGSKLIQEGVFSEKFYFFLGLFFGLISIFCAGLLALLLKSILLFAFYAVIMILAWGYSLRPAAFSYRRLGELIIFLLFGPGLVISGYFLQAGSREPGFE